MIELERTREWEAIKAVVTHPKVYLHVSDDFSPSAEAWEPIKDDTAWYVLVRDAEEVLGLWAFFPENAICWDVHTCLLPTAYGERARQAVNQVPDWIWQHTQCVRIVTKVPAYNRIALKFAKVAGMTEYGCNPRSYMKDGKLHDLILLGMSKGA